MIYNDPFIIPENGTGVVSIDRARKSNFILVYLE